MTDLFATKVTTYTARLQRDLTIKGFQADGIFGNIGHECNGFKSLQEQSPIAGRGGYGWMQWTGPRRVKFENWCRDNNRSVNDDEANYLYLIHESTNDERAALEALRLTHTRDDAVRVWMEKNERPGVPALDSRISWAKRAEAARLQAEGTSNMDQQQSAIVPHLPAVPNIPETGEGLTAALSQLHQKLEGLAPHVLKQAGSSGGGASLTTILLHSAVALAKQYNVPARVGGYIKSFDVGTPVAGAVSSLAGKLPTGGMSGLAMMPLRGILQNPNLASVINGELQSIDFEKVLNDGISALVTHAAGGTVIDLQANKPSA
jgi:hypothetical protein